MEITFYRYTAERNRVDKSSYLKEIATHEGVLKTDTSMENPVILMQGSLSSYINENSNYVNYFYIYSLGRYYFVTDIVSVRNNLTEIHGHVDVLYSFKDSMLANYAIIQRSESDYNLYIDDSQFMAYQNQNEGILTFGNAFTPTDSGASYILIMAGKYGTAASSS